jgi:hypothetical protein
MSSKGNKGMMCWPRYQLAQNTDASRPVSPKDLRKAFTVALLLTGNMDHAETSVLQGIAEWDPDAMSVYPLFQATVKASLLFVAPQKEDLALALPFLPPELQNTLDLPWDLRQCFVLRVLAGFSRRVCAQLLGWKTCEIDRCTCAAMVQLSTRRMNLCQSQS